MHMTLAKNGIARTGPCPYLRRSKRTALNLTPQPGRTTQMATVTNRTLDAGFGIASILSAFVGRISAWNDARVTRKALEALSDRELDDLGLNRGDIDSIANGIYR